MSEAKMIAPLGVRRPGHHQPDWQPERQPRPQRRKRKIQLLLLFLTCLVLALVVIAQYSQLVITNYRISEARNELKRSQEEVRLLETEAAGLSSLARIEAVAREELGMVEPEPGQLRLLSVEPAR